MTGPFFDLRNELENLRSYLMQLVIKIYGPLIRDLDEAEDLVQNTFVEALEAAGTFQRRSDEEYRSWMRILLVRQSQRMIAKEDSRHRVETAYARHRTDEMLNTALDNCLVAELKQKLKACMLLLSEQDRTALQSLLDGIALKDWAARTGIDPEAAKKRRFRAFRRLKEISC